MKKQKIYVGTFEFDKEELETIFNSLHSYKKIDISKIEICNYLILKFKELKEELF